MFSYATVSQAKLMTKHEQQPLPLGHNALLPGHNVLLLGHNALQLALTTNLRPQGPVLTWNPHNT